MTEPMLSIKLADGHVDAIRSLADHRDEVVFGAVLRDMPLGSEVLIDSSGATGWMICVLCRRGIAGTEDDLSSICRSLCSVGRKREREIAGRIRAQAIKLGVVAADGWEGLTPVVKAKDPRSIEDVASAWASGTSMKSGNISTDGLDLFSWRLRIGKTCRGRKVAIDYRQQVSCSTSRHVGAAIRVADRVESATNC